LGQFSKAKSCLMTLFNN